MESRLIFLHLLKMSHKGLRIAYKKSLFDYDLHKPYLKPTQVGELNIRRGARYLPLRNSAK